jgi:D-alanyl-D-alanine dipeptidase
MWKQVPDERYVANPEKGSRHNRGAAVDVTLADSDGKLLLMPTGYDDFSERAHRDCAEVDEIAAANAKFLEKEMQSEGFIGLPTEWWHFDYKGWENYPVTDIEAEYFLEERTARE